MRSFRASYPFLAAFSLLGALLPFELDGQIIVPRASQQRPRFTIAGDLLLSQPKGDLANYIDRGFGTNFTGLLRIDPAGVLSLRGDFGALQYGRERVNVPVLTNFGRVTLRLTTTNSINWFGLGLQTMLPTGPIRPYVNGGVGTTNFSTTSTLTDPNTSEEFGRTTNKSDYTSLWTFGGGLYVPLGTSSSSLSLNIGGRYFFGGEAEYLQEGGIEDNPDGSITLNTVRSKTDFVTWQLGLSYAIPNQIR
jgi:opacity protein-like surface antigen